MKEETAYVILDKIEDVFVNANIDIKQMLTIYAKITSIVMSEVD